MTRRAVRRRKSRAEAAPREGRLGPCRATRATLRASSSTLVLVEAESTAAAATRPPRGTRRASRQGWSSAATADVAVCTRTTPCACSHGCSAHMAAHAHMAGTSMPAYSPAAAARSASCPTATSSGAKQSRKSVRGTAVSAWTSSARCSQSPACRESLAPTAWLTSVTEADESPTMMESAKVFVVELASAAAAIALGPSCPTKPTVHTVIERRSTAEKATGTPIRSCALTSASCSPCDPRLSVLLAAARHMERGKGDRRVRRIATPANTAPCNGCYLTIPDASASTVDLVQREVLVGRQGRSPCVGSQVLPTRRCSGPLAIAASI